MKAIFIDREALRTSLQARLGRDARLSDAALLDQLGPADHITVWTQASPPPGLRNFLTGRGAGIRLTHTHKAEERLVDMACHALGLPLTELTLVCGHGGLAPLVQCLLDEGVTVRVAYPLDSVSGHLTPPRVAVLPLDLESLLLRENSSARLDASAPVV